MARSSMAAKSGARKQRVSGAAGANPAAYAAGHPPTAAFAYAAPKTDGPQSASCSRS